MKFNDNEYVIKREGDLETITITKEALEKLREHYALCSIGDKPLSTKWYYDGKMAVCIDILKHFDEEEV